MLKDIESTVQDKMEKSINVLKDNLMKIRTGRAHTGILDQVSVNYYNAEVPISQVASVSLIDARNISVKPYERNMIKEIDKAIRDSNLGLNPAINGDIIRVPMPMLTEERRKDLIKIVKHEGEEAKVAVRNARRDANQEIKNLLKDKEIGEDEAHKGENSIQKITDKYILEIDQILSVKEKDLLEI